MVASLAVWSSNNFTLCLDCGSRSSKTELDCSTHTSAARRLVMAFYMFGASLQSQATQVEFVSLKIKLGNVSDQSLLESSHHWANGPPWTGYYYHGYIIQVRLYILYIWVVDFAIWDRVVTSYYQVELSDCLDPQRTSWRNYLHLMFDNIEITRLLDVWRTLGSLRNATQSRDDWHIKSSSHSTSYQRPGPSVICTG